DVRFPVFVIITKCDKVNGFREFFDGVTDPQLQHQMMGWSNPSPLDEPFRPDLVDAHLSQVVQRLRKRRLGLLRDPVPENPTGRRTDEVDSLYALPHSLSLIAPRLRRYLETIFVAGEWSAKPLFLRGIYFSSSMREGSALDAELAEAIGVPVDDLPEGKVWERERAYFLRDLFVEKVFRERGLVTRASNTARMLRTQQVALFGFSALALLLFLFFAWFGTRNLETTVKKHSDIWVNATNWFPNRTWKQSIVPLNADGSYADSAISQMEASGRKIFLGEFHARLREQATNEMKANWMMPGLAGRYNHDSRRAQRVVFEGGVVKPLVEAARKKMERALNSDAPPERGQAEAFTALLRFEGDLLTRNKEANKGEVDRDGARRFLSSLLTYVTGKEPAADTNFVTLVDVMSWTYSENEEGRGKWPPAGLSGAMGPTNSLANNAALRVALDLYLKNAGVNVQTQFKQWTLVSEIVQLLEKVQATEPSLFRAVKAGDASNAELHCAALNKIKDDLDRKLTEARQAAVFQGGLSLTNAYARFNGLVGGGGELDKVRLMVDKYRQLCAEKDQALFTQILERLRSVQAEVARRLQEVAVGNARSFPELDKSYLVSPGFLERGGFYAESFKLAEARLFAGSSLVGEKAEKWQRFTGDTLGKLQKQGVEYTGDFKGSFDETAAFLLERTRRHQRDAFFAAYMEEARRKLGEPLGFPLAKSSAAMMTPKDLQNADKHLTLIAQDLISPA
ncbi:MAG TPA: type VI secretion system protein, partial [Candidatus Binatia bacterium]|nr:type VI secretion system protein [Candidatus Binatia bacterium]